MEVCNDQASGEPSAHKGPLVLLPDLALSWKGVADYSHIFDVEKYKILKVVPNISTPSIPFFLTPKGLVLLGVGETFNYDAKTFHFVREFKEKYKLPLEIMRTVLFH